MLDRIKKNVKEGVKSVKWFAAFLADRTRVETSMARLLYESNKLENRLEELYRDVGIRVLELKGKEDKSVFKDFIILQTINEITKLKEEIEDYKTRADEISKPRIMKDKTSDD
jgi:PHP family Zn ribbon phosphoesterase